VGAAFERRGCHGLVRAWRRDDVHDVWPRLAHEGFDVAEGANVKLFAERSGELGGSVGDADQVGGFRQSANRQRVVASHFAGADHGDAKRCWH
jgi:hypothetical protein